MGEANDITLTVRDTAGQESFDAINAASFEDVDVFIMVFALTTDQDRFNTSLENVYDKWYEMTMKAAPNAKWLLVGSMKDYQPVNWKEEPHSSRIADFAARLKTRFISTSSVLTAAQEGNCKEAVDI